MRLHTYYKIIAASSLTISTASADVYLQENFDSQTTAPGTPTIGHSFNTSGSTGSPFSLSTNPALGTKSLELVRQGSDNPTLNAFTLDGLMKDGATVEFDWAVNEESTNRFNAPEQVQIGMSNGGIGRLVFIGVNDPGNGSFFYTDQNGNMVSTGVQPSLNTPGANEGKWDRLRAVFNLQEVNFGDNYMTGTMNLFVSLNGAPEQTLASNVALAYGLIPADDPTTAGYDESTAALMKIQKGPFTGITYYDNLLVTGPPRAVATGTNWAVDADGSWSNGANWQPATAPNDPTATASFGTIITATRTVTVDSPQTVGTINFSSPIGYIIAGPGTITLDNATFPVINVTAGSHAVSAPVVMNKSGQIIVAAGATLSLSGDVVSGAGSVELEKDGDGQLSMKNLRFASAVIHDNGTLSIMSNGTSTGTSVVQILTMGGAETPTSTLDLTNNRLIIDYPDGNSPISTIQAQIAHAYVGGNWTSSGITSSTAAAVAADNSNLHKTAIGLAEASAIGVTTFGGQSVDSSSLLLRYTYVGDANLDGVVNALDFNALATNFGASGKAWFNGDFNYDGTVNTLDFTSLASNFGLALPAPVLGSAVPEPTSIVALAIAACLGVRRRNYVRDSRHSLASHSRRRQYSLPLTA
jgi:hypothetical protein